MVHSSEGSAGILSELRVNELQDMLHISGGQGVEERHIPALSILLAIHDKGIACRAGGGTGRSCQLFAVPGFFDVGLHTVRKAVQHLGMLTDVFCILCRFAAAWEERDP